MFNAMFRKELRENIGFLLLILACYTYFMSEEMRCPWCVSAVMTHWNNQNPDANRDIIESSPFLNGGCEEIFFLFAAAMALVLGLRQSLGESVFGTWMFLLHRPATRRQLIAFKLLIGLLIIFAIGATVLLLHAWRAATPGIYSKPFFWWMTTSWWEALLIDTILYLTMFLIGVWPARWYGARLLPVLFILFLAFMTIGVSGWLALVLIFLADAVLLGSIFYVVRTRDYA